MKLSYIILVLFTAFSFFFNCTLLCGNEKKQKDVKAVQVSPASSEKPETTETTETTETFEIDQKAEIKEGTFVTKTSSDVFGRWLNIQEIRVDHNLNNLKGKVDAIFVEDFMDKMPRDIIPQINFLFPRTPVYNQLSKEEIDKAVKHLEKMRSYLESDISLFVDYLIFHKFTSFEISMLEQWDVNNDNLNEIYRKYRNFLETLLHDIDYSNKYSVLNSVANRFFEYCFYPTTFNHFTGILKSKENFPVARFLYEVIWYYLARGEWYAWHGNTLSNLKREHDQGKEVVYIAGGNDIFQLISSGIYNIRNIDPIYPTQTRYYSEGWDFLAKGNGENKGLGDTIVFDDPFNKEKDLIMRRVKYKETGLIAAAVEIEDTVVSIPESVTVWSIETKDGKKLGKYTLERRFVEQRDFRPDPEKALLISFNELYFIMTASDENWGINPRMFNRNIQFHVKQLRSPINHRVLMNIRTIQESEFPNRFGSSVIYD